MNTILFVCVLYYLTLEFLFYLHGVTINQILVNVLNTKDTSVLRNNAICIKKSKFTREEMLSI